MHCVEFFFEWWFRSNLSIYLQNYVKNGLIFKTTNQKKINTVHNLITFSIVFTNKNRGGGHFEPPPLIIPKVKVNQSPWPTFLWMPFLYHFYVGKFFGIRIIAELFMMNRGFSWIFLRESDELVSVY